MGLEFDILNPPLHNAEEINALVQKSLLFALFYAIALPRTDLREELSERLLPLTGQEDLYEYCFNITSNSW